MKKLLLLACLLAPTHALADRLGTLTRSSDVLLSTQTPSGSGVDSSKYIQNNGTGTATTQNFVVSSGSFLSGGLASRGPITVTDPSNGLSGTLAYDPALTTLTLKAVGGTNNVNFDNAGGTWAQMTGLGGSTNFFSFSMSSNNVTGGIPTQRWKFFGDARGTIINDFLGTTIYSIFVGSTSTQGTIFATNGINVTSETVTSFGVGVLQSDASGNITSSALSFATGSVTGATQQFNVTVSTRDSGWATDQIPIWTAPADTSITISSITACTFSTSASTLTFNLEERTSVAFNSAGTDVFTIANATANNTCATYTSSAFSNNNISAGNHVILDFDNAPEAGTVQYLKLIVYYKRDN